MKDLNKLTQKQKLFFDYLISHAQNANKTISIDQIGGDLNMSATSVRELLELAKAIGLVKIEPRKGIQLLPYKFSPAVSKSLQVALCINHDFFDQYFHLRNQIEKVYFRDAVMEISQERIGTLKAIVQKANDMLNEDNPRIPHAEHRSFHLIMYQGLENVFVYGILESFWDMYEMAGLNLYEDLEYLRNVWNYHEQIIDKIEKKDINKAYSTLVEHMELIHKRPRKT